MNWWSSLATSIDGHFAESDAAKDDYRISFSEQRKSKSVFRYLRFPCILYLYYIERQIDKSKGIYTYMLSFKKNRSQTIFLNPITVCYLFKRKFVVCPSVIEVTNGSCPFANFANGLNGLSGLAHPWPPT
jgi:hypothetical protein